MITPVNPYSVGSLAGALPSAPAAGSAPARPGGVSFGARLEAAIADVSDHQNAADVRLSRLASGDEVDVHATMIALEEADITLRLMVASRDAAVEAFERIQNLQI
jgi:flagellar hook-basal body complex protein FliE